MYNTGQSGSATAQNGSLEDPSSAPTGAAAVSEEPGHGPAIEVVQLSNGDVIWTVLDSLRQDDEEDSQSFFRRSMSSRGLDGNDEMEIRVKGHGRYDSKGSNVSQGSHTVRRRLPGPNAPRPETKVFKINSSTIGRLIDDLSKTMNSGSFNFQRPAAVATPSNPTSFHSDDVERELEALLKDINTPRQGS
ncbi:hypothetical protein BU17DRAFT_38701 [Hysterangium stoloniferum]|nr:hypothetical protein BU17DRAFT_38701 [Hysterangium stoloniferum]